MFDRKNIIIVAILATLTGINNPAQAGSNDLLKMDIKRSSLADSVDVVFYTTGNSVNTVVTRKDNNRYVVLLPNVSGNSSVVPNLGGLKDLITDVNVKNIDDGIGGYTKVTFNATKPVKIQASTKHTQPLTQAQQDYKNLIAKNSMYNPNKKAETTTTQKKSTATAPAKTVSAQKTATNTAKTVTAKPATNSTTTKAATKPSANKLTAAKSETTKPAPKIATNTTKPAVNTVTKKEVKNTPAKTTSKPQTTKDEAKPAVYNIPVKDVKPEAQVAQNVANDEPKMKFDENGKRIIDLEPKVDHRANKKDNGSQEEENLDQTTIVQDNQPVENVENNDNKEQKPLPIIPIAGGASVLGLLILLRLLRSIFAKHSKQLKDLFEIKEVTKSTVGGKEFEEIMHDNSLSWQERFKRCRENDNIDEQSQDLSFVTDMSGKKSALNETKQNNNVLKNISSATLESSKQIPIIKVTSPDDIKARISRMEHAFNQTPSVDGIEEVDYSVKSEDDAITNSMSHVKLRSFADNKNLKTTSRTTLKSEKRVTPPTFKEGHFVKLRESVLSTSRRKSAATKLGFSIADLVTKSNKYLTNNRGIDMNGFNENYSDASLNEYLSILDMDNQAETTNNSNSSEYMTRSVATNPIANTRKMPKTPDVSEMNGLVIKSGHSIDENKGIYLVNLDGNSAVVGKVGEDIFVLKKFDKIVNQPLQVRLDHGSVYIVKVGGFKCLVEVSDEKMGTLLEI